MQLTTADYALIVSILSMLVALVSLAWNIWSKFIYPKPKVRVSFAVMILVDESSPTRKFLGLTATNFGPSETTIKTVIARVKVGRFWRFKAMQHVVMFPLDNFPSEREIDSGPFGGGLPKKLAVGEQFSAYLTFRHKALRDKPFIDMGFVDVFGRYYWAPRKSVVNVRKTLKEEFVD